MKSKLVRDKIPDIIQNKGKVPITHLASDNEYLEKLKDKLVEEVDEFLESSDKEELADILEVIHAICYYFNIDNQDLEFLRKKKSEQRGGFSNRIILDEVK
ncbi:MAG: nucleoside triphosphate pyrophosphohydrolase [Candidatus Peribacteraceae bacterium]|nr:nucleoside triphosphate pyrophosphohydrolase [Candidatus Peribacteraceae bacterium]